MLPSEARRRREERVADLMNDREGKLPVWIRSPKNGKEYYTGLGRTKLYELAGKNLIRSVSIRTPGQLRGIRLFHLPSILAFIEKYGVECGDTSDANVKSRREG